MANDPAVEIASVLQFAHINRQPSPRHDINPSTAASEKEPVRLHSQHDPDAISEADEDEIPISVLQPLPRRKTMPPLPDLRFEQSYLKSIEHAESWKGVLWITFRDQVLMCFTQGMLWALTVSGWQHFNRSSKFSGQTMGARIRRWWWGVNKWSLPKQNSGLRNKNLGRKAAEYYKDQAVD
ncbi:DUF1770-domain-containing protein [Aaosphaeria arxii CBS 175.79]|uniref:DUF1770-domain-containing protein n=1 Tax=Aaosphaeria arxii CBS 175.79 TaxID=1450172 RepID=A0A6A5XDC5_9PLEO|nr:DUF1770-domain-containing protein [Aaosphaeria arxii CBS 175.79]KAF2011125.1 DUF1770-domain-containing protein [Aaosphaeria arxii CBS 175.79]